MADFAQERRDCDLAIALVGNVEQGDDRAGPVWAEAGLEMATAQRL